MTRRASASGSDESIVTFKVFTSRRVQASAGSRRAQVRGNAIAMGHTATTTHAKRSKVRFADGNRGERGAQFGSAPVYSGISS
jgi:hypothetical protein